MRLYLDQMLRLEMSNILRREGHDVIRASEIGQERADDDIILKHAINDGRILITLDEHFGDWAILPLKKHPGVIRIRVNPTTTKNIADILIPFLKRCDKDKLKNNLVIVSPKRERWIDTSQ